MQNKKISAQRDFLNTFAIRNNIKDWSGVSGREVHKRYFDNRSCEGKVEKPFFEDMAGTFKNWSNALSQVSEYFE